MGAAPLVSVIAIAYNVAPFVEQALDSVLSQPGVDLELIVVDDESTDGTWEMVQAAAARDGRVKAIRHRHAGHPSIVRNHGIRQAAGRYVTFLDGDDWYFPSRLEKVARVFAEHPDLEIVFHDVRRMHEDGRPKAATYLTESSFLRRAAPYWERVEGPVHFGSARFFAFTSAIFCGPHTSTITIRRDRLMAETIWFPEDLITGEDLDLWYRLVRGAKVAYLDEVLSGYREREASVTRNRSLFYAGTIEADLRNLARVGDALTPAERVYYIRRIGSRYKHLGAELEKAGDVAAARQSYLEGFRLTPKASWLLLYAKSFVPRGAIGLARRGLPGRR